MNRGPWPKYKDNGGHTIVTIAGVRWKVAGTDHLYSALVKAVKNGEAERLDNGS